MSHAASDPLIWRKASATSLSLAARLQYQMRLAAEFAGLAAGGDDVAALQTHACQMAADGLGTEFAKLLVYLPQERAFLMRSGVGWQDGLVGAARFDADDGTAAGFAWRTGQSVLSDDIVAEGRFRVPEPLARHGIVRSVNVVVPGSGEGDMANGEAFGVLEAESSEAGAFVRQDVYFLQILAHSLSAAMAVAARRQARDAESADEAERHLLSMQEMQHRVRNDLHRVVTSLHDEARATRDPLLREGFDRVSRRIIAVAGLYDHLLRGRAGAEVDLGAYLDALCGKIAEVGLPSRGISLVADMRPWPVSADRAVQLAIAVNELVANAAAHAFPDGQGTITVRLRSREAEGGDGDGGGVLTVGHDGMGFQGPRPGSAGLRVAEGFVRQAGGALARGDGPGTQWRIALRG